VGQRDRGNERRGLWQHTTLHLVKYWTFNPLKYLLNIENPPGVDEFSMTLVKITEYEMCPIQDEFHHFCSYL
jgi:hypothetical protein